jgi:hypothetical protein
MATIEDNGSVTSDQRTSIGFIVRIVLDVALAGHLVVAALAWWLSPRGFPIGHPRFWLNSVVPAVVAAIACSGFWAMLRRHDCLLAILVFWFSSAWCVAAITGRILFPASLGRLWLVGLCGGITGFWCFSCILRVAGTLERQWLSLSILPACLGCFVVWAQLPPQPSTRPTYQVPPLYDFAEEVTQASTPVKLSDKAEFRAATAELHVKHRGVTILCAPLLTFDRTTSDGFWSLLASHSKRGRRKLQSQTEMCGVSIFRYSDDATIQPSRSKRTDSVQLTAFTPVPPRTFSHLNSYCVLEINGHEKLSLSFSPCPDTSIDVLPADYPTGRPARFAYLDESAQFVVVEATSGEKGPFHTLASGKLRRGEALSITLHDNGKPVLSVSLEDWSQQLSTALSPTAGWRVPMNAIEFQRLGNAERSSATIWITLAATSVGRGWDCVGHRAGSYRNRLVVQPVEP